VNQSRPTPTAAAPGPRAEVVVAALRRQDVPRCVELEHLLFPGDEPWSEHAFHAELDAGNTYLGAYTPDGALVGYAGLAVVGRAPHHEASVHTIGVAPEWQGVGIGRTQQRALRAEADRVHAPVFLEVRTDNEPAIGLYRAHGFERIGLRRRYYQPSGADAYTMARPARDPEHQHPAPDPGHQRPARDPGHQQADDDREVTDGNRRG
jgi:ribosomal-protein-alanine N-acetyltransferase